MEFSLLASIKIWSPSLMVGNTIVLKPASATMGCGIEIEKAFSRIGVPEGVFQTLVADSSMADVPYRFIRFNMQVKGSSF